METSPSDRLANLFLDGSLPTNSESSQPDITTVDVSDMSSHSMSPWHNQDKADYPYEVKKESPELASVNEPLTNSEEDEYVAAFSSKPKMKSPRSSKRGDRPTFRIPEPDTQRSHATSQVKPKHTAHQPVADEADHTDDESELDPASHDLPALSNADQQATLNMSHFCQFNLVARFPYKYIEDENDRVSRHFFANNKFFEREWDIFYLHPPASLDAKPILLLPYEQVKELIDQISRAFDAELTVPPFPFTLSFVEDGTPHPVKIGTTNSREAINDLQDSIPPIEPGHGEPPIDANHETVEIFKAFKMKCEKAFMANKRKNAAAKKKRDRGRLLMIQEGYKQLQRVQRYFGLRRGYIKAPEPDPSMTWAEQQTFFEELEKASSKDLSPLDSNRSAPFAFDHSPVIISVDLEAYERNHSIITEIGISTLDTIDLIDVAPGKDAKNWTSQIRSRHFRIAGREHYVNKDFCIGDPNSFQFGESEFISIEQAGEAFDQSFQWPYSVQFKHDGTLKWQNQTWAEVEEEANNASQANTSNIEGPEWPTSTSEAQAPGLNATSKDETSATQTLPAPIQQGDTSRTIVLVGHGISSDLEMLAQLNSTVISRLNTPTVYPAPDAGSATGTGNVLPEPIVYRVLDTAILYRDLNKDTQTRSLTNVLMGLGRQCYFMHNAGNDARYTLEALIAIAIRARQTDDEAAKVAEATRLEAERENALANQRWNNESAGSAAGS